MKNIKLLAKTSAGLAVAVAAAFVPAQLVSADSKAQVQSGVDMTGASSSMDVPGVIAAAVNFLSVVVGALSVIMIIVAGFKYVTSGGDSGKVTSAKNTIVYAVVGLIIVILAQAIVKFVLEKLA